MILLVLLPCVAVASSLDRETQEAIRLLDQKQYSQALVLLHSIESRIVNPEKVANLLAVAYLGRGYQLLSANDFSMAREAFLDGRRYNEDDLRLWQGEAMVLFRQGQYAEAASVLEQVLGIAQQNGDIYHLLGKAYYADGRMAEALDALTKASELGGDGNVISLLEKARREWQVEMEMGQEVRGHFQLSFADGEHSSAPASAIIETLEDAYSELGSELAYYPDVTVPVLLYSQQDFASITRSPDWAGAVYDGKIRLPLGGINRVSEPVRAILYHEYTHVLVHYLANRRAPVWLNEGLAELAGRRIHPQPLEDLSRAVASNQLLAIDELTKPFAALPEEKVRLAYEQSFSVTSFMVDNYGWHKMKELLESLGRNQAWQSAIASVYIDYGLDWPAIQAEWLASLGR
jgi:tetratricopeptide (TPR) repeat protein